MCNRFDSQTQQGALERSNRMFLGRKKRYGQNALSDEWEKMMIHTKKFPAMHSHKQHKFQFTICLAGCLLMPFFCFSFPWLWYTKIAINKIFLDVKMKRYNCHGQIVKLSTLSLSKRLAKFSLALPIAFKHLHKGKHKQTNKQTTKTH